MQSFNGRPAAPIRRESSGGALPFKCLIQDKLAQARLAFRARELKRKRFTG